MKNLLVVIAASMMLAACASTPKTAPVDSKPTASAAQAEQTTNEAKLGGASSADVDAQKLAAQKAELAKLSNESVYFDFDKSGVKTEFRDVVAKHAEWMKSHENDQVTLEGNCDERGSPEYNLALGSRRAASVHKALVIMGISEQRIKDVSFGEEKPKADCDEEKCWQQNRRVDFVHQTNQ